jgi:hypothetical protein
MCAGSCVAVGIKLWVANVSPMESAPCSVVRRVLTDWWRVPVPLAKSWRVGIGHTGTGSYDTITWGLWELRECGVPTAVVHYHDCGWLGSAC